MRRFYLQRNEDASGVSGTGRVAEGCEFSNGRCVLVWLTAVSSMGYYDSIAALQHIHGHEGRTKVVWLDDESGMQG